MKTKVIGITGSISVGKSTVTNYLLQKGYVVLDADKISHHALDIGTTCYERVKEVFGCVADDQTINRQQLGQIVFHDQEKKKQLEEIIHPYVIDELKKGIQETKEPIIFLDIPLLYETHLEYLCDQILVVYVNEDIQAERLMKRNHIDRQSALHLMQQQISIEKKKELADYVIDNSKGLDELYENIEKVLKELKNEIVFK